MTEKTGGQAVVDALRAQDVNCVFGLIGSATMELFDALFDADDVNFIGIRDERTGTHMADGYARASGKAGVILAGQNGPGVTNLVTGIAQAQAVRIALLGYMIVSLVRGGPNRGSNLDPTPTSRPAARSRGRVPLRRSPSPHGTTKRTRPVRSGQTSVVTLYARFRLL